jgi:hypothetical protein
VDTSAGLCYAFVVFAKMPFQKGGYEEISDGVTKIMKFRRRKS